MQPIPIPQPWMLRAGPQLRRLPGFLVRAEMETEMPKLHVSATESLCSLGRVPAMPCASVSPSVTARSSLVTHFGTLPPPEKSHWPKKGVRGCGLTSGDMPSEGQRPRLHSHPRRPTHRSVAAPQPLQRVAVQRSPLTALLAQCSPNPQPTHASPRSLLSRACQTQPQQSKPPGVANGV